MFREGQEIGIYTLIKRIGRGGFGEVWLAERRAKFVTTKVAVKLPFEDQIDTEAIKHEAVLWEQASGHPNVLPIIDADEYDGQIVIVSEYAPDGSLEELLKKEGVLPIKKAVNLTDGILSGLEFLHTKNIIHRDIKPANILLQGETPRLADFGISRVLKATSQSSIVAGTPSYMAPEAFDGKRTMQTDIWSVGVILYRMIKGSLPFSHSNLTDLLGAIVMSEPQSLPESIPHLLQGIIFKALAKRNSERYQTVRAMREDLADFLVAYSHKSSQPEQLFETFQYEQLKQTQFSPTMKSPYSTSPHLQNSQFHSSDKSDKTFEDKYQQELKRVVKAQEARLEYNERRKGAEKRAKRQIKFAFMFAVFIGFIGAVIGLKELSCLPSLIVLVIGFLLSYYTFRNPKKK